MELDSQREWESHRNGNKTPTWEPKREGVGMNVDGNGIDLFPREKNPMDLCTVALFHHNLHNILNDDCINIFF